MFSNVCLLFVVTLLFTTKTRGFPRYRRQLNQPKNNFFAVDQRTSWASHPAGSIPGTYYYGVGSDPNYGSFIKPENRPHSAILPISYDPDSSLSSYLINSNRPLSMQQLQQQQYLYNNNYAWQRPNMNNYYNKPYNAYSPGNQGWYATGGNYWYNKGPYLTLQPYVLISSIFILITCT
ncbi:unnamed protein product [Rotaria socialis]|uniref:Uncharacterized protein n=2 Tax=Rotaria socialis TaxID=392032 RepID=A0A820RDP6_9BILA|nr:unnamed protein product [Rotaria socialis]CAF3394365.1 unnamed protein product [Rotaria socialis]CAF3432926.1 unnamed protein product [Rotaria socialis]CAF3669891.1 unnamed protein product [Rotaria socialis]CAF4434257.1 unnamed protein product [Rotaria socialis]